MKKNIFAFFLAALTILTVTSCKEEAGTEPGNDSMPVATLYKYSVNPPYNSDNDVALRIVANSKVEAAYYVALKSKEYEQIAEGGDDAVAKYVVEKGKKLDNIKGVSNQDIMITELYGSYVVAVAAVSGSQTKITKIDFVGLEWESVVTGTYTFGIMGAKGFEPVETELQVCTTDENLYRFKDLFGTGYSLKIRTLPDYAGSDEDGNYMLARIPNQATGCEYGDYGEISVRDVGYWQNNDAYVTDYGYSSYFYEDYYVYVMAQWYVSGGNLGYNAYDSFEPNL